MPHIGAILRWSLALLLLAGCGRGEQQEVRMSAAPVRHVVASLAHNDAWTPGKCLCVGHFREDAVEDFPAGILDAEFAGHPWLHKWSECEPYYGRANNLKGCSAGMVDFVCSVSERTDLPQGTARVLCHVNGQSEALQKEGYLQDEYDVTLADDGQYVVHPVSLKGTGKIHE